MPRPAVLKRPKIVSLNLEEELCILLDQIAAARGLKSRSAVARQLLEQAIKDEAVRLGLQVVYTPSPLEKSVAHNDPSLDPLLQVDIEDFEEELGRFEKELSKLKADADYVARAIVPLGHGAGRIIPSHVIEYTKKLSTRCSILKREWLKLKGWYRKLPQNPSYAERLARARRTLKDIEKLAALKA